MMTLQEILESDRDSLLQRLEDAPDLPAAADAVAEEFGRILITFNEDEKSARVRGSALEMLQAAKAGAPLTDSAGEPQLYAREAYAALQEKSAAARTPGYGICLGIGLGCGFAEVVTTALTAGKAIAAGIVPHLILTGAALLGMFLAGRMAPGKSAGLYSAGSRRRSGHLFTKLFRGRSQKHSAVADGHTSLRCDAPEQNFYAVLRPDAEKIYRHMLHTVMLIDHALDEVRSALHRRSRGSRGGSDTG